MIIQSLIEKYEILEKSNLDTLPLAGSSAAKVSYLIRLRKNGSLVGKITDIRDKEGGKKGRIPQIKIVPEQPKRTSQVMPFFLSDNATYLLGLDMKNNPEKARKSFLAAKKLHEEILQDVDIPAAKAVLNFFRSWDSAKVEEDENIKDVLTELKKGVNLAFSFMGKLIYDFPEVKKAWKNYLEREATIDGFCSITGEKAKIARLHPLIKGVQGAQTSGASLVSFNAEAYSSFGNVQGMNAPISEKAAFAYAAALNYLLSEPRTHRQIAGTTLVFWANKSSEIPSQIIDSAFASIKEVQEKNPEDGKQKIELRQTDLLAAMKKLQKGEDVSFENELISPKTPFYILGLSPNAARLSIRFYAQRNLGFFVTNLMAHQERLNIIKPEYEKEQSLGIDELLNAVTSEKSRDKKAVELLAGELLRSIVMGNNYPYSLITLLSMRIKADRKITSSRAAIIKAYYLKNRHPKCPQEVLHVELNKEATNAPYLLGRAFAVLEKIQWSANAKIDPERDNKKGISMNKTIADKYFNSAATTPSYIFPILLNLSQHHLRKLASKNQSASLSLQMQLSEILAKLDGKEFPKHLTLPEQGSFQLGYYHERQSGFAKAELKKAKENTFEGMEKDE